MVNISLFPGCKRVPKNWESYSAWLKALVLRQFPKTAIPWSYTPKENFGKGVFIVEKKHEAVKFVQNVLSGAHNAIDFVATMEGGRNLLDGAINCAANMFAADYDDYNKLWDFLSEVFC